MAGIRVEADKATAVLDLLNWVREAGRAAGYLRLELASDALSHADLVVLRSALGKMGYARNRREVLISPGSKAHIAEIRAKR